jgi:hypothetical protein
MMLADKMLSWVFRSRNKNKIIKAIVGLVSIDVMNNLIRSKRPPNMTGHHEAMLRNIAFSSIHGIRMAWIKNEYIPTLIDDSAANSCRVAYRRMMHAITPYMLDVCIIANAADKFHSEVHFA